jgi:hypothetical protein
VVAEQIPKSVKQVVLEWKGSGSKLSFTKIQPVNAAGMVVFDETLSMVRASARVQDLDSLTRTHRLADDGTPALRARVKGHSFADNDALPDR